MIYAKYFGFWVPALNHSTDKHSTLTRPAAGLGQTARKAMAAFGGAFQPAGIWCAVPPIGRDGDRGHAADLTGPAGHNGDVF